MAKSTTVGTIPCLVCGDPFASMTTGHMRTHPSGPQTDPSFRTWVAEKWGVGEADVPPSPAEWRERKHLFPN